LDDEDFEILREQKIRGRAFLELTETKLMAEGMKLGPAIIISRYIKKLKGVLFLPFTASCNIRLLTFNLPLYYLRFQQHRRAVVD
jgi:hypothetical protein